MAGHEEGLVLVRSFWRADVDVLPWRPLFEITHRRLVPAASAASHIREPDDVGTRIAHRALADARL